MVGVVACATHSHFLFYVCLQLRDLRQVATKLKYVLASRSSDQEETIRELRKWDLWGPLLLCLMLST